MRCPFARVVRGNVGAIALLVVLLGAPTAAVQAPRIFFTDLQSGPATGGEQNLGVFVTLYGERFGAARGASTVTFGGVEAARYVSWAENVAPRALDRIVVQPGPGVTAGPIVVTVDGLASTGAPFTVRAGGIYFVAPGGSDADPGTLSRPWATVAHAEEAIGPGDTVYVRDGVVETDEDAFEASLSIETSGAVDLPKAIVAYPGALATIGSTALTFGIRVPNTGISPTDWVLAGLRLRGQVSALDIGGDGASRWRIVGNDISCPVGDGQTGCFAASLASYIILLGNEVHDIARQGPQPSKQYHAVYFTTDTNWVAVGWNHIHDNLTCRAIQFHSSPLCVPQCGANDTTGFNQHHLDVFDNRIDGDVCDGINFATVDPSQGAVRAWNNVILHVGAGPDPPDGAANYDGIFVAGATNTGPDGSGQVDLFHNTLVDCGAAAGSASTDRGAFGRGPGSPALTVRLRDDLVAQLPGEPYVAPTGNPALISGSHNLWHGNGPAPSGFTDDLAADPLFLDPFVGDYRLAAASPAIDSGIAAGAADDYRGANRILVPVDRGAFENVGELFADSFEIGDLARWSEAFP
ncbi:MAG: IPT/TIG domain-containing protein [Thermoanaerobaculia bacterium]